MQRRPGPLPLALLAAAGALALALSGCGSSGSPASSGDATTPASDGSSAPAGGDAEGLCATVPDLATVTRVSGIAGLADGAADLGQKDNCTFNGPDGRNVMFQRQTIIEGVVQLDADHGWVDSSRVSGGKELEGFSTLAVPDADGPDPAYWEVGVNGGGDPAAQLDAALQLMKAWGKTA